MPIDPKNIAATDAKVRELVHAFDTEPATGAFTEDGHAPSFMTSTDNLSKDSSNTQNTEVFEQAVHGLEELLQSDPNSHDIESYVNDHFYNRSMYIKGEAAEPQARQNLIDSLNREFDVSPE